MKVIIAGSRHIKDFKPVEDAIRESGFKVTTVISGGARGVDGIGQVIAIDNGWRIEVHPANWDKHGRAAGPIRNRIMAQKADALIAVWDGSSRGTASMIHEAKKRHLRVYTKHVEITKRIPTQPPTSTHVRRIPPNSP